ncbi:MAG TPA: glycosyltransferase family 39 protein [Vicinamibacterales bacterium]|nr:glycosyltransferase family 39 protein [Vicinamibacterales bacterium]
MLRRPLLIIALVALAHAALYIVYQQGEWQSATAWTDQRGYQRLGAALATTGQFTRYADSVTFVPEVIRTPGYPLFVALIYKLFGVGNDLAVAIGQAVVFASLCVLVFLLARRAAGDRAGLVAAGMTALYSPLPYFGSLIVTELWTTFVATAAILACLRAAQHGRLRDYVIAGALFTGTTMVRPAFVLLPFFLAVAVPLLLRTQRTRPALQGWAALAATAAIALVPWLTYNYANLGQLTLSPAGGIGRGLWEGSWQGRWSGRLQRDLINLAESIDDRDALNVRVAEKAAEVRLPAEPMLQYVNEWRDIRDIWNRPTDPMERARARVEADRVYASHAVANMREDPIGHVRRRLTVGLFVLWAADVPIRYGDINAVPTAAIRGIWLVQVFVLALAVVGAVHLARTGRWLEAVLLVLPIVYVTGVHLPLLCETRQSLPVKPVVLALAAIGVTRRSLHTAP